MSVTFEESLRNLVDDARQVGRQEARRQVMDIVSSLLDNPDFVDMTNVQVVRWITEAIKLEFAVEKPLGNDVQ